MNGIAALRRSAPHISDLAGFHYGMGRRMVLLGRDDASLRRAARWWARDPLHLESRAV